MPAQEFRCAVGQVLLERPAASRTTVWLSSQRRCRWWLLVVALSLCGCKVNSARPGTVCGHCDYRFSYQTPNPCDACVRAVELPCYGYTPTSWQIWPDGCADCVLAPAPHELPPEGVPLPDAGPPEPVPSARSESRPAESAGLRLVTGRE